MIIEMQYYDFICRNHSGELVMFENQVFEPHKDGMCWIGNSWVNEGMFEIGKTITDEYLIEQYKYLTWEDNPIKITRL